MNILNIVTNKCLFLLSSKFDHSKEFSTSGGGRLFELKWEWEGGRVGWALIPSLGANSRVGAESNKYGTPKDSK